MPDEILPIIPQFQPPIEAFEPERPVRRYAILGSVVVVLVVLAFVAVYLIRKRSVVITPEGVNAPVVNPVLNPTDSERAQFGLDADAKFEVVQTPTGPATIIVYPDRQGAPPQPPVQ